MSTAPDTDPAMLLATAKIWRLGGRTFAAEVDRPFYHALQGLAAAPRLRALGLTPLAPDEPADAEQALTDLAVDYCRLFIGPDPICPPYASLQRGHAHLGNDARRRIDAFLDNHCLAVHPPDGLPILANDHVSVAFAVLDQLYTTAAGQPRTHLPPVQAAAAARDLLDTYLMDWVPRFLNAVQNSARQPTYRSLSRLIAMVLNDVTNT